MSNARTAAEFPRIVFFDMEGTLLQKAHHLDDGLVAPSAWTLLAEKLGPECLLAENKTKREWREKKYSGYMQWVTRTVQIHQEFGLTKEIFASVVNAADLMPNAPQALETIRSWGTVTVLISGGFKALADLVQRKLKIRHSFVACEYFFSEETGLLEHANLLPADEVGKMDFMRLLCREYGVDPEDCAFVGDGMNDVHLAQAVGYSIAFNAQEDLRRVCSDAVVQERGHEDFMEVVRLLQRRRESLMRH